MSDQTDGSTTGSPGQLSRRSLVLVVDDTESQRYVIATILRRAGFRVLEADSGEQGLSMLETEQPAAVICDVCLPDINGFRFCAQVTSTPATAGVPVILLSAAARDISHYLEGHCAGAVAYLYLPVEEEQLVSVVRGAIAVTQAKSATATRASAPATTRRSC